MAEQWPAHVRRKKSLTLTLKGGASTPGWVRVLGPALEVINKVLKDNNIQLTFSKAEKPINAHIVIDTMQSTELHGKAKLQYGRDGRKTWIDSVQISLPAEPRIIPDNPKSRLAGDGVRLYLLVHELIHCIGPLNEDHTPGDVFSAKVNLIKGDTAADDTVYFDAEHDAMPPIRFDGVTIEKIKTAWPNVT